MSFHKLNSLQEDILLLYANLKNKNIENIFIKVANQSLLSIDKWMHHVDFETLNLSDKNVWYAFGQLAKLKKDHPSNFTKQNLMQFFLPGSKTDTKTIDSASIMPYLILFGKFVNNPDLNAILGPYSDILNIVNSANFNDTFNLNQSSIENDLKKMIKSLESFYTKPVEKEKTKAPKAPKKPHVSSKENFVGLFQKMFKDLTAELQSNLDGKSGVFSFGKSWQEKLLKELPNGVLANPLEITKILHPVQPLDKKYLKGINDLLKYLKTNQNNSYHELLEDVKHNALLISKAKSSLEIMNHVMTKNTDFLKNVLNDSDNHGNNNKSTIMEKSHYNDKNVILYLSLFLYAFLSMVKS